ncbi:MAG: FixH family protein [Bacteroidota bacterium]|nr:FixH family protein [Bacteroidota bacterium]
MKIKFNWGTGIVIALIVMISGMIFLVSIAVRQDYDLVDKDYYQKSINYQQHIEEVGNTERLAEKVQLELSADSLKLIFPKLTNVQDYSGEIHFYSPVEEKRDLILHVKLDSVYSQSIDLKSLKSGRYQVKIDWIANKGSYYQEEEIAVGK